MEQISSHSSRKEKIRLKKFEKKHMPSPLPDDKKKDPIFDAIMKEEVKQYVIRKNNINGNIQSAFGLI